MVCLRICLIMIMIHDSMMNIITCTCWLNLPLLLRLSPFVLWKGLHLVGKWQLHRSGSIACLYHMRSLSCVAFEKIRLTENCNRSPYFRSSQEFLLWILTKTFVNQLGAWNTRNQLSRGQDWRKYRRRKAHIMSSPRSGMPKLNSHKPCYDDRIWQIHDTNPFFASCFNVDSIRSLMKQTQKLWFF